MITTEHIRAMAMLVCGRARQVMIYLLKYLDMAKKDKKRRGGEANSESSYGYLKDETLQGIIAILFFVLSVFFTLSSFTTKGGNNLAGFVGEQSYKIFHDMYFLLQIVEKETGHDPYYRRYFIFHFRTWTYQYKFT